MTSRSIIRGLTDAPKIHIFVSGDENATVAEVIYKDDFIDVSAASSSKRMDSDPYDQRIGTHLAVGRALRDVGRSILKDGNDMVKMEAKRREEAALLKQARDEARRKKGKEIRKEMERKAKEKAAKKARAKASA